MQDVEEGIAQHYKPSFAYFTDMSVSHKLSESTRDPTAQ